MLKTYIELPGGRVLSSGTVGEDAIVSVTFTSCVNSGQELSPGAVCAGMLEAKILGSVTISAGDRLQVWRLDDEGNRFELGVFLAEKPTRAGAHFLQLTAYDPVVLLDRDVTGLLKSQELQSCSMQVLAETVCRFCGLALRGEELPLGQLPVTGLSGEGITGRQVLRWIGELNGLFCRANIQGELEFDWYRAKENVQLGVSPGQGILYDSGALFGLSGSYEAGELTLSCTAEDLGDGKLQLTIPNRGNVLAYDSGGLTLEAYAVAEIEKVWLKKTQEDVGTVYPDGLEENCNTYTVTGNPLLGAIPEEALLQVAEHLYTRLQGVSYTPCKVSLPANYDISAGDVVQLTDKTGKTITVFVMTKTQSGQKDTLECTGSPRRDSTTAVNNQSYADLQGKVLNLRMDLNGLMLEHSNTADRTSKLELDMEGIRGQVSSREKLEEKISTVEQTADAVKLSVEKIQNEGTDKLRTGMGYTFDDQGLNIHSNESEITNRLDETGMQVLRNAGTEVETVMLRADVDGVVATDVKVRNFLVIGTHARLEDYGNGRTACFWLEGE